MQAIAEFSSTWFSAGVDWRRRAFAWLAAGLALLALMPVLVLSLAWLDRHGVVWQHLADTVLWRLLGNTLMLVLGVGTGVLLLGVGMAWLVTTVAFPGRVFFERALMLPFAMPAYVLAFVMLETFDYAGPLQTWLRDWLPGFTGGSARQPWLVIVCLVLVFYPYVYLLTRSALLARNPVFHEQARVLGLGPWQRFRRVTLPLARPAIVAGLVLALMETLADFGAVSVFNFDTFTTAIYKSWYGLFNLGAAAQLASTLLVLVLLLIALERFGRGKARYVQSSARRLPLKQVALWKRWLIVTFLSLVLTLSFVWPVLRLLQWVVMQGSAGFDARYWSLLGNTVALGVSAGVLVVVLAWGLAHARQRYPSPLTFLSARIATLGYALPGSVLAVGILFSFVAVDRWLGDWFAWPPILMGSWIGLLLAYVVRFLAVAFGPVEAAYAQLRPSLLEAARTLSVSRVQVLRRLYLPLLAPGLSAAVLLVMIDVMKEMPATLLLRPFGADTLAVRIYAMTAEGLWDKAALPALTLVVAGLLPVLLLMRQRQRRPVADDVSHPPV